MPVARPVRTDDGSGAHAGRAHAVAARTLRALAGPRCGAAAQEAAVGRRVVPAPRHAVHAATYARHHAAAQRAVPSPTHRHRTPVGSGGPRHGGGAVRMRAGPLVPRRQPRHDRRARGERLARHRAARAAMLRRALGPQRPPRHGSIVGRAQRDGLRGRGPRHRELGRMRRTHADVRRPRGRARSPGGRRHGVPRSRRPHARARARSPASTASPTTTPATRCAPSTSTTSHGACWAGSPGSRSSRSRTGTDVVALPASTTSRNRRCRGGSAPRNPRPCAIPVSA